MAADFSEQGLDMAAVAETAAWFETGAHAAVKRGVVVLNGVYIFI
jgi:hypothetical protein